MIITLMGLNVKIRDKNGRVEVYIRNAVGGTSISIEDSFIVHFV